MRAPTGGGSGGSRAGILGLKTRPVAAPGPWDPPTGPPVAGSQGDAPLLRWAVRSHRIWMLDTGGNSPGGSARAARAARTASCPGGYVRLQSVTPGLGPQRRDDLQRPCAAGLVDAAVCTAHPQPFGDKAGVPSALRLPNGTNTKPLLGRYTEAGGDRRTPGARQTPPTGR